ncbi:hypothetical protein CANCADRAFT_2816 [Tortispora caseinolytica NRRL Y-17796]|uniref:Peptide-methionine (R)-S-oxide reductase n=1 Tax=Tortispora caseinolytica NRRL Y-17796 TaxID=767744 RepID=A0A1E4THD8_9ASCO|nr:hypothetical protein CANCADRAFT_2816 [Tortispora caseinolytica NRRL Y-17796]
MAEKTDAEWQAVLNPEQFRVLRELGTEKPGTGEYEHHFADGVYKCVACGNPLYKSETKFDSGCGWPAFFDAIPGAIETRRDTRFGKDRTEMICSKCKGHLGHIFKGEGYDVPTDTRHCVNSVCLKFEPQNGSE